MKSLMKQKRNKFLLLLVVLTILFIVGLYLWPVMKEFTTENGRIKMVNFIRMKEYTGIAIFIMIQIIQVIIFIIPGEFIEIVGGMIYGPVFGYLLCQIGMIIATILIYYLVKYLGYDFIQGIIGEKKLGEFTFLKNEKKLEIIIFILYFIPGTPKDALTFLVPFTNISLKKFILISTIARFPTVISSTLVGSQFQQGNYKQALYIFVFIGIISLVGIVFNKYYLKKKNS